LDVHQAKITACAISEDGAGNVSVELAEFGGFKRDRKALARWVAGHRPEVVVMESTGIYWKSPYAALEDVGIAATVVNARHVKTVPGRKTDWADAQWLAMLARAGMLRASFVPPAHFRALRLVGRQRQKLVGIVSGEKNRMHKLLCDGGIRLSVVVSDIHGVAARRMIKALLEEKSPTEVLLLSGTRLKADRTQLLDALDGDLTAEHRFVLQELMAHIEELEHRIARFDLHLLSELAPYRATLALMQTIPGIDAIGAALLLVEIGNDMDAFGSVDRLASWVGICPGNNESAGTRKSGRIRKGNAWVRRLLCEFAQAAARTRCALKAKFDSLNVRKGHKKSVIALVALWVALKPPAWTRRVPPYLLALLVASALHHLLAALGVEGVDRDGDYPAGQGWVFRRTLSPKRLGDPAVARQVYFPLLKKALGKGDRAGELRLVVIGSLRSDRPGTEGRGNGHLQPEFLGAV
jgi:transposase